MSPEHDFVTIKTEAFPSISKHFEILAAASGNTLGTQSGPEVKRMKTVRKNLQFPPDALYAGFDVPNSGPIPGLSNPGRLAVHATEEKTAAVGRV